MIYFIIIAGLLLCSALTFTIYAFVFMAMEERRERWWLVQANRCE